MSIGPKIKDPILKWTLIPGLLLPSASLILSLFFWHSLPPEIPLFYSRPWGQEQLASPFLLIIPFALGASFLIISFIFFKSVEDIFLKKILMVGGSIAATLIAITILRIIFLIKT